VGGTEASNLVDPMDGKNHGDMDTASIPRANEFCGVTVGRKSNGNSKNYGRMK
jgi:hypothetical protein